MNNSIQIRSDNYLSEDMFSEMDFLRFELSDRKKHTDEIIDKAAEIVAGAGQIKDYIKSKEDIRFEVVLTSELKEALKDGSKKLDKNSAGEVFAQIRDAKGKFSERIPIRELPTGIDIDPLELSYALKMKAIEEKLDAIVDTLEAIDTDIKDVLAGQDNDRLGLYYSGVSLYREAVKIQDSTLQALVTSQALKTISDAYAQEMQCVRYDVDYLISGKHLLLKKPKDEIRKRINSINKCFQIVHRSAVFKAGIYFRAGELQAMLEVLDDYSRFLNNVIAANVGKLSEMDEREKFINGGSWSIKADFTETIEQIKMQIPEKQYIEIGVRNNGKEGQTY